MSDSALVGVRLEADERESRRREAERLGAELADQHVTAVATTFIDNSGIARVKTVPLDRLPVFAAWGAGFSTSFDHFRFDDWIAAPPGGRAPVGDLRLIPDLARLVPLAAQPGWAWAPGDRYAQDGTPHEQCSRLLLRRVAAELQAQGLQVKAAYEIEWVLGEGAGAGEEFVPAMVGPGYGMTRLIAVSDFARDLLQALAAEGVAVQQFHPEYAAGQLELSVAAEAPVDAADTSVLVRSTIRAVAMRHGFRVSFSPKVEADGVGNGGHVHLSVWRDGRNLMAEGDGPCGLTRDGEAFAAGVLDRLPALLAIGSPSVASYLRLIPSHWAGAYACWGLENREAAVRMVGGGREAANLEVKCIDLTANPYLLLAAVLVAGAAGIDAGSRLPAPVDVDPAALPAGTLAERGIQRLPTHLGEAADALAADDLLRERLGGPLVDALLGLRRSEVELFATATDEEVVRAQRWRH